MPDEVRSAVELELIRQAQCEGWALGKQPRLEELLESFQMTSITDDELLELILCEYQLACEAGASPAETDYYGRFPRLSRQLARLFEVHRVLLDDAVERDTSVRQPNNLPVVSSMESEALTDFAVELSVIMGPHAGQRFEFREADRFLVGRGPDANFRLPKQDQYFSRSHFLIEINPPLCKLTDLNSANGTFLNGKRVEQAILRNGDRIEGGETVFEIRIFGDPEATVITPKSAEPVSSIELVPPAIPGYEVVELIGQGGMGCVFRAINEIDGTTVAIKTIRPALAGSNDDYERFLREMKILRDLEHPHIVRYLDEGEVDGLLYLIMEFVPGKNAKDWVTQRGPMSVSTAVRFTRQLLAALQYAHDKRYVHRDIKPANLLLWKDENGWRLKLADFGLARTYYTSYFSGLSHMGAIGGTLAFMPPEQITNFRQTLPISDQYSAAGSLYFLLTGQLTHDFPKGAGAQLGMVLSQDPVPIQARRPDIPDELSDVVHRALSRSAERRFKNCATFGAALQPFIAKK